MIKKFNTFIDKYILNIFIIFLISHPILDALLGLFNNKVMLIIDYIIKGLFILLSLYYVFFISKKNRKYIILLILYSILYLVINYLRLESDFIYELKVLIKVIYFPISLLFVINLFNVKEFNKKYLAIVFTIYLILILVPNILHIGNNSYEITKQGSVGFFISANMIGNTLSIIFPIFLVTFIEKDKKILLTIMTLLYMYTLLTMGTKGPLICLFIMAIYYLVKLVIYLIKNKKYLILSTSFIILLVLIIIFIKLIPNTAFYKNLIIHLEFLNIKSFKDFLTFKNIDHFIFGSRFKMLSDTFNIYIKSGLLNILFGIGYTNNGIIKTCEMDYFVLLIHQGLLGFMIIYYMYFKKLKDIFKNFKFGNIKKTTIFISVILSILCAFFVGHTLDAPSVSIFVSTIIGINLKESR